VARFGGGESDSMREAQRPGGRYSPGELAEPTTCYIARMVRRLRIAASVFFAIVTVTLAVLLWRSYRYRDEMNYRYWPDRAIEIVSIRGRVELENGDPITDWPNRLNSYTLSEWKDFQNGDHWGFSGNIVGTPLKIGAPQYVLIPLAVGLAVAAWLNRIPRRYSLRTMLIATTVVALILGAFVILSR
jgi:hypothetical protein